MVPGTNETNLRRTFLRYFIVIPAATAAYALVLHAIYQSLIQPNFAYMGYDYHDAPFEVLVVCWLAASAVAAFLPAKAKRASSIVIWLLFVIVVAPTMLTLPYMGSSDPWHALVFSLGIGAAFTLTAVVSYRKAEATPLPFRLSTTSFWLVVTLFSALTYGYIIFTTGISFEYLSIADVYDQRADYREALAEASLLGYLVANQANVVNPVILAMGVRRRRPLMIGVALVGQLILYTSTGFKSVLFSLAAIAILLILFKIARAPRLVALLWGAAGLLLFTWLLDVLSNSVVWSSLFGRRFLFTPARLTGLYFEWYSNNPLSLLGNSVLRGIVDTDYDYGPARTIAIWETGAPTASLNANIYASGFAEFGWFGLLGVGVLLGIYLRVLDRSAAGLPTWMAAVVVVMPSITMSNTAFHTAILSHGLLAAVILLAIAPRTSAAEGAGKIRRASGHATRSMPAREPLTPLRRP